MRRTVPRRGSIVHTEGAEKMWRIDRPEQAQALIAYRQADSAEAQALILRSRTVVAVRRA